MAPASICHITAAPTCQHCIPVHERQRARNVDVSCCRSAHPRPTHFYSQLPEHLSHKGSKKSGHPSHEYTTSICQSTSWVSMFRCHLRIFPRKNRRCSMVAIHLNNIFLIANPPPLQPLVLSNDSTLNHYSAYGTRVRTRNATPTRRSPIPLAVAFSLALPPHSSLRPLYAQSSSFVPQIQCVTRPRAA